MIFDHVRDYTLCKTDLFHERELNTTFKHLNIQPNTAQSQYSNRSTPHGAHWSVHVVKCTQCSRMQVTSVRKLQKWDLACYIIDLRHCIGSAPSKVATSMVLAVLLLRMILNCSKVEVKEKLLIGLPVEVSYASTICSRYAAHAQKFAELGNHTRTKYLKHRLMF